MHKYRDSLKKVKTKLFETGFFHIFGSNIINQTIAFFSGIILVRILSKTDYGIYSYAYSIVNFFLVFNGLGATSGLLQICSETGNETLQKSYYRMAQKYAYLFDILLTVGLIIVARVYPFKMDGVNSQLISMSLLPIAMLMYQLKSTYCRATLKTKEYSYFNTGNAFLVFVLSITGAFLCNAEGVVIGQTIAYIATAVIMKFVIDKGKKLKKVQLSKSMKEGFVKISLVSAATNGVSQIMNMLDVFILGVLIPNGATVASYKVGSAIPTALAFVPGAIVTYVYPYFARNKDNKNWTKIHFKKLMYVTATINGSITIALIIMAPIIIKIVFGIQYMDSLMTFRLLSLSFFFSGTLCGISGNLLVTQRKLKFNFWRAFFMGIVNAIGNVAFITMWGPVGAAISTLCVSAMSGIIATIMMKSVINKLPD